MKRLRSILSYALTMGLILPLIFCGGGGGDGTPSTVPPVMEVRGASLPWIEYEAESAPDITGTVIGPSRTLFTVEAESSGRRAVKLSGVGQHVKFTTIKDCNSIVVRYCIPDADNGGGIDATLSLYINGVHNRDLNLTSKYCKAYGGFGIPYSKDPAAGSPLFFYDETRALIGDVPAGSTIMLQKDSADTAAYYIIDLIDLEKVGPPLTMPENFISIADYGAIANDGVDDGDAIRNCIAAAKLLGKGVWIPPGVYESTRAPFGNISNVTIRGAGMWHSVIHGLFARFNNNGNNCQYYDFAILGETTNRDDYTDEAGFSGQAGTGSRLENIWIEHTKCGYWVGGRTTISNGLVIKGCRIRNTWADGINFCDGSSNCIAEQNHARNTGDDSFASWSPTWDGGSPNANNIFRFNTAQLPWRANCFAIYGGNSNKIEDNLALDTCNYPGVLVEQGFNSYAFSGITSVQRNTLTRCGGSFMGGDHGALEIFTYQGDISDIYCKNIDIIDPTYSGIMISGTHFVSSTTFSNIMITNPTTWGLQLLPGGTINCDHVTVIGAGQGGLLNEGGMNVIKGDGNSGW